MFVNCFCPERADWRAWCLLLGTALGLRLLFYSGFFGSDELTYVLHAYRLLDGDWSVSPYVGGNRYGWSLPVAGLAALLGRAEWVAASYSMACSVAEIALLAGLGGVLVGQRTAWAAAWVLAFTPMHIHLSGRLDADAPMALAVSASFLLFCWGELQVRRLGFLAAGLAAGWAFWLKPAACVYLGVFALLPVVLWRWRSAWVWAVLGLALMVGANCLWFGVLTGDGAFLFKAMSARRASGYLEAEMAAGAARDAPYFYLQYLFFKIHHTGLMGPLALLGLGALWRQRSAPGARLTLLWSMGLLALLSLLPIGWSPLVLIPKQTNYMALFLAPLALLAALGLQRLPRAVWGAMAVTGLLFAALLQAQVAVFTANSRALLERARLTPEQIFWVSSNAHRAAVFEMLVRQPLPQVRSLDLWTPGQPGLAYLDPQTLAWGRMERFPSVAERPICWQPAGELQGRAQGAGPALLRGLFQVWPGPLPVPMQALVTPQPALLFSLESC
ncbi:4-amino-4-deoxy-L-arabinose transferase-like glycosyltransferase [Inhella inkyongensis]|uniref:4-amino-4-deoxy-L-arabinose transferase-like glycosyltransferase n=1 Tax=Inhella inkyongensis TaxID=392593 RepID=A0A840S2L4_9BURK|nr:glycosyltransferase family 39 protein [Inhella inkyongensis]MBB5203983.1 4-amino-4-deoxy-L-arabinose transferase-like glycosyltransferase [Inhella inkyongensis]